MSSKKDKRVKDPHSFGPAISMVNDEDCTSRNDGDINSNKKMRVKHFTAKTVSSYRDWIDIEMTVLQSLI